MEKSLSFLLSSFLSFLLPSLCNALSSCPLSEAPSWPSSNPYGKNNLQEMSLSHLAHLAKCARATTRWYESEGTHLRIRSSRVQLAFNKTCPFLLDSWAFLGFLCAHVSSQTVFPQQKSKPEFCSCGTCFSPHMLKVLWQGLYMFLLAEAHLYLAPHVTNINHSKPLCFLKN